MNVIALNTNELQELYCHALRETYQAEMDGLSIHAWVADHASCADLRRLALDEVDRDRANLDSLREIIISAVPGLPRDSPSNRPDSFDWAVFAVRRFSSARVRDLAMVMSIQGISSYRLVRYRALADIAEKLQSGDLLDGLRGATRSMERTQARMRRLQSIL